MALIHADYYKPRVFPIKGDIGGDGHAEIDRAQTIDPTTTLNREEVKEIGRHGVVGYMQKNPTVTYRLTQLEYGNIEFYQMLINNDVKGSVGNDEIALADFKTAYVDICGYLTDDDDTFKGTLYYPSLRTSGFSISIGDPQDAIERAFDFVGEATRILTGDNKYLIYKRHDAGSAGDNEIDLSDKAPNNPNNYISRLIRGRDEGSGRVWTELTSDDYSYDNGTQKITITDVESGDIFKVWYSSSEAPDVQFTPNDSDVSSILGDSVSIYLYIPGSGKPSSSDYIYRLQSVTLDVTFDREDIREIGNKDVVARGITNNTVTVTLGRILDTFTIEEALAGDEIEAGVIDVEKLSDNVTLLIKVFSDNTKETFKYGFKATGLTASEIRDGAGVGEYTTGENTLEGEELIISADSSKIGI